MFNKFSSVLTVLLFVLAYDSVCNVRPNIIIVFTDDMGYADVGCNEILNDNQTPNVDALAKNGIRMTAGYASAPQCTPSRAGLITGQYQNKFGLEENTDAPLPLKVPTIAEKIKSSGYITGLVGKWHLEPHPKNTKWLNQHNYKGIESVDSTTLFKYFPWNRGFDKTFCGNGSTVWTNFDLDGNNFSSVKKRTFKKYRIDLQTEAALSFIKQHQKDPFFLYLSYFGPHSPLSASQKYLSKFSKDMPNRRRLALAMNMAMDEGVGRIVQSLSDYGILENTIVFFVSDNGAPLILHKKDVPIGKKHNLWNGSLNDPWLGEKGMLTEGGIRVPFLVSWKGTLPENTVYNYPVTCLDISATAVALAGGNLNNLDGVNLIPYLCRETDEEPHEAIFWKWRGQEAVRNNKHKYLRYKDGREYLFDLAGEFHETKNIIDQYPEITGQLKLKLNNWIETLPNSNSSSSNELSSAEKMFRDFYLK